MVCLGNICRSPLAEGILKSKLPENSFLIDSAGTGNYHIGSQPDHRSVAIARTYGIDITNQRARQFSPSDFDAFDHIFVMDISNYNNVISLAENEKDINKVELILEILGNDQLINVPDPYFDDDGFEEVFKMLDKACLEIAARLNK
jgi:protein-tyrosine phosphatase